MHSLETVLSLPLDAMYRCLGDYLEWQVDRLGIDGLSEAEATLWHCRMFEVRCSDGGLLGFKISAEWKHASTVATALDRIGATQAANIVRLAVAAWDSGAIDDYDRLGVRFAPECENIQGLVDRVCSGPSKHLAPYGSPLTAAMRGGLSINRTKLTSGAQACRRKAPGADPQAFVIDFQCFSRSAINSARCRSSRPSRMVMSSGSARK
jgi:hypothetical protein